MKNPLWALLFLILLPGCAKHFEPMQPDDCWACFDQGSWTMEDIHVQVNRVVVDKYYQPKRPQLNGYCLETAELKYEMALKSDRNPEIVILRLDEEVIYLRGASSPYHAVLVVDDTVYDNGFLSYGSFDRKYLKRYGTEVPDIWSDHRRIK